MQNFSARCPRDKTLLFEVPDFEAFHKKSPVVISCRGGCGRRYVVEPTLKGGIQVHPYGRKKGRVPVLVAASGEA